ncbi:hypothetical protein [Microvirga brassicacearum]|uniref:Uncharacterized protein n=1 Tax=Microvirga brassicacearum TaxID=2580413 RepID=A0A5N3P5T7_9HYPH|nr:hypothetical protein [Microvirga brassicacearum]KAB0265079.1 hypothetical protein FEZ63_20250 [Microvirga brassicacearum]
MLDVYNHEVCFYISTHALQSAASRQTWINEAQKLGLSEVFVTIAMEAAEKGARMICASLNAMMDTEHRLKRCSSPEADARKQER